MRWAKRDQFVWRRWLAWHPINIDGQTVWLEWVERRFCGDCYEVRRAEPFWTSEDRRQRKSRMRAGIYTRRMRPEEAAAFDAAFDKMDEAFRAIDRAFGKVASK